MTSLIEEQEVETVTVRAMQAADLRAVVRIDAESSGRERPRYFELMVERIMKATMLQMSLVAEVDGRVVGFVITSLHYGEFGMTEPTASIEAIGVDRALRGKGVGHALFEQLRRNVAAIGTTSIRTEVEWRDFDLLAFLSKEGFKPAARICLERTIDPTE